MRRRTVIASVGLLAGGAVSGCMELLRDEPVTFEATPPSVPDAVLTQTGYAEAAVEEMRVEQEFEAAGQSREVVAVNWQAEYQKAVELDPIGSHQAAVFSALSTPKVEVLGREFNPVAGMSSDELAEEIQDQYDQIDNVERDHEGSVTVLGETTDWTRFTAESRLAATTIELFLHVFEPVESGDDLVLGIGAHPRLLPDEEDHVIAMAEGIEHGG